MADIRPPTTALFSLSNDAAGGVAVTITYDAARGYSYRRTDTGAGGGERVSFRGKAVPAGNWDAYMKFEHGGAANGQYDRQGFAILENATGKSIGLVVNNQNGSPNVNVYYFSSLSAFSSSLGGWTFYGKPPEWFRINYDGTNYTFYASLDDKISWTQIAVAAKATYFTADRIGAMVENFGATDGLQTMLIRYYADPDFP